MALIGLVAWNISDILFCVHLLLGYILEIRVSIFDITVLLNVAATSCSHLPGTVLLEDISGVVL